MKRQHHTTNHISGEGWMNGGRYIYILPFGDISSRFVDSLALEMEDRLNLPFRRMHPIEVPEYAFHPHRKQYLSFAILRHVIDMPIQTFIFGQAQMDGTAAVVSMKRLDEIFYGRASSEMLLFSRTLKEAMHELGHTLGLGYCDSAGCVMSHSTVVEQVDQKKAEFCTSCRQIISSNIDMEKAPCRGKFYRGAEYWWLTTKRSCADLSRAGFRRMALR